MAPRRTRVTHMANSCGAELGGVRGSATDSAAAASDAAQTGELHAAFTCREWGSMADVGAVPSEAVVAVVVSAAAAAVASVVWSHRATVSLYE